MRLCSSKILATILLPALAAACGEVAKDGAIIASGHVEATEVRVSTKIGGTLARLEVDEGDRVEAGQVIGRIDTVDLELGLASAQAERAGADADLRLKQAGYRREDVAEAEAQVRQAEADLGAAQKDLDRMQSLLDSGSGIAKSRDDALARRDVAAARLSGAREQLGKLRAGFRVEEIDAARARLQSAEARIAQLRQNLSDAVVASPVAGIVTAKLVEQGEILAPGATLVVVTDLADAWLNVYVGEPDLGRLRIGQEATVRTDDGQSRTGRVTFVASQAEFTPKNVQTRDERVKLVFKVKVGLDNADGLFKPGMPAEATLAAAPGSEG